MVSRVGLEDRKSNGEPFGSPTRPTIKGARAAQHKAVGQGGAACVASFDGLPNPYPLSRDGTNLAQKAEFELFISNIHGRNKQYKLQIIQMKKLFAILFFLFIFGSGFDAFVNYSSKDPRSSHADNTIVSERDPTTWTYSVIVDEMSGDSSRVAMLSSLNSLNLDRPYSGSNYGRIYIRHAKKNSEATVILSFEKGQSMCTTYSNNCDISIKFDSGPIQHFTGKTPSDGSSNMVFIEPSERFIKASQEAKKIRIALTLFRQGQQIFDFETSVPFKKPEVSNNPT